MRKLSFSMDKGEGTRVRLDPETEGLRRDYALKVCREKPHPFPTLARSFPIGARNYLYDTFVDRRRVHAVRGIVCMREDIEEGTPKLQRQTRSTNTYVTSIHYSSQRDLNHVSNTRCTQSSGNR